MAEPGLIDLYLVELRADVENQSDADDVVAEAQDHLHLTAERYRSRGLSEVEAERRAIGDFGSSGLVARAFATQRKGVIMPTTFTRRTGLAAVVCAICGFLGQAALASTTSSEIRAWTFVPLTLLAVVLFFPAVLGLRARQAGRLGRIGTAGFLLMLAGPLLATPFSWVAGTALIAFMGLGLALISLAMWRANILPRGGILLLGGGLVGSIALAAIMTAVHFDAGKLILLGQIPSAVGLAWLGWFMWREEAVEFAPPPATA